VETEDRHIWNEPPSRAELAELARLVGGPEALLSRRSTRWRELGLEGQPLAPDAILDLLAREPRLLRRPIVTDGRHAAVGFNRDALAAFAS
jgi:regulatory protein spx